MSAQPAPATVPQKWIVSRGVDLSLVLGGSLAGYAYLLLYIAAHVPISYLWWFWSIGFDGTHIFATASRTFFDRDARARQGKLLYGSAAFFFALGPTLVLAGLMPVLIAIVAFWAYYHVVRQHYGVMVLYKVKNRDLARADNVLDRIVLGVMLVFPPFQRFFIHHPEELGAPRRIALARLAPWMEPALWGLVTAVAAVWMARQLWRLRGGERPNLPKYLLFAGIFPLHFLTFRYMSWQAAVPTVTIVHNLQYHALVWFHNRNRYGAQDAGVRHGRIPSAVAASLASYILLGLAFSALYRIPGFHLGKASQLAFGFFAGFGLTHYYLDSKIWRVRHDPSLRQALRLA